MDIARAESASCGYTRFAMKGHPFDSISIRPVPSPLFLTSWLGSRPALGSGGRFDAE
jgi:hypothetical protein